MSDPDLHIRLQPFELGEQHIRRRVVGRRPFRDGGCRLEAEVFDGKHVVHCYGHGGSGWTLAPGCGRRIGEILGTQLAGPWSHLRGQDVTIAGAGVIGLFAAYYLSQRDDLGRITIVAENVDDLTSHNAGGLFEPFVIGGAPDDRLLAESYGFYHALARDERRDPDFDATDVELLSMFSNDVTMMPSLVSRGYIPDGLPVSVLVNEHVHRHFVHLIYFLDVAVIMRHLQASVARRGVRIMRGIRLDGLAEAGTELVVNCTGLGARTLARDPSVRPVTGHLIRLQGQPRALFDIEHNLHVLASQSGALLSCLARVDQPQNWSELERLLDTHHARQDNVLQPRLATIANANRFVDAFARMARTVRQRLERSPPVDDPDIAGLQRVRLFDDQPDRNRFIDSLSLLLRVTQVEAAAQAHAQLTALYAAILPRYAKRYVMLFEESFPSALTSDDTGAGISYFMPVLDEAVYRDAQSHFHYRSDSILDQLGAVGVCGGTSIDRTGLTLAEHEREFANLTGRLRHFGFA